MSRPIPSALLPSVGLGLPLILLLALVFGPSRAEPANQRAEGYVGSEACAGCHTHIYHQWKATRHSYSVLTAEEARRAGYPLPQSRPGGPSPAVHSWEDISYVIGGRQRIAYADNSGRVLDMSYQHRTAGWGAFPPKTLTDCGLCHFTGFGAGTPHSDNPAVSGRWVELNIGCEACHGPGGRHAETYEPTDIVIDPSSRLCGRCHTAVGRVLPVDDLHETHDLVQVWNRDPHVTGGRFHSHNAQCSRCHSPYEASPLAPEQAAKRRVFAEDQHNITCIACHNPHGTTNARYKRSEVALRPPLPPRYHLYRGNDRDFTTTDFRELKSAEQVCTQCHTGADRVDLDHGNATCSDCHVTFARGRTVETRVVHDPNHPRVACRSCHTDGDHLAAIVFGDPDFLQPKRIHNLRRLPAPVVARYGFRYPALASVPAALPSGEKGYSGVSQGPGAGPDAQAEGPQPGGRLPATPRSDTSSASALGELLASPPHQRLAADETVRVAHAALVSQPERIGRHVELALIYARRGESAAARVMLDRASRIDSPWVIVEVFGRAPESATKTTFGDAEAKSFASAEGALLSALGPDAEVMRSWLLGYLRLRDGRFAEATEALVRARALAPERLSVRIQLALAELGRGRYRASVRDLKSLLDERPAYYPARVTLGLAYLRQKRFAWARAELDLAVEMSPRDAVGHYLLGRGYLSQRDAARAIRAFQACLAADPGFTDAWFSLAHAHLLLGGAASAAPVYRQIVDRRPGDFEARLEYGKVLKVTSDRLTFQARWRAEQAPAPEMNAHRWRESITRLERQAKDFAEQALSQFTAALGLRPDALEASRQVCDIHRRTGRLSEALECHAHLSQLQPAEWIHRYQVGAMLVQLGRHEDATAPLREAVALDPTQGDAYLALGLAYALTGRLDQAIAWFEQGAIHAPFNPALFTNLGAAYARRGEYGPALRALLRALELSVFPLPRIHLVYTNLALVDLKEGRRDDAVRALTLALDAYPDYGYARQLRDALAGGRDAARALESPVFPFNDLLELFREVTTVTAGAG